MRWFGRAILLIATLCVVAAGAGVAFQRQIGAAVFNRAVGAVAGVDRTAALPDGLHVFVCGSGSPMPDPGRAGPCLGIVAGERAFVVDAGSGGARRLARMGFPMGRIERVYLTHLHSDHFDGLGELLLQAWVGGSRSEPLPIVGPAGIEEIVAGLNQAYRIDAGYRTAHHGPDIADPRGFGGLGVAIEPLTAVEPVRVIFEADELRITAILVDHAPVEPAYGYRIDYKDRSVVISGDTKGSATLTTASQSADILFHEALNIDMVRALARANRARGQERIAHILADIEDYHATPEQAARTAEAAGVSHLILYHIVPPLPSRYLNAAFLGNAPKIHSGRTTLAVDGLVVSAPAASRDVAYQVVR